MVVCTYVCLCVCARAGVNMYYISISLGVCNISIKINTSVKKRMDWYGYNNATSYNDSHIADSEIEEYSLKDKPTNLLTKPWFPVHPPRVGRFSVGQQWGTWREGDRISMVGVPVDSHSTIEMSIILVVATRENVYETVVPINYCCSCSVTGISWDITDQLGYNEITKGAKSTWINHTWGYSQ